MSIIDALGSFHENAKRTMCSGEENCILNLDGFYNYIILKGELICEEPEEICDCLVFINETGEQLFIAIVEFKTNNVHVSKVANQIEKGSTKALLILENCSRICLNEEKKCLDKKKFCLIAVARHWNANSRKRMKSIKIIVDGRPYYIHTKECGDLLSKILS